MRLAVLTAAALLALPAPAHGAGSARLTLSPQATAALKAKGVTVGVRAPATKIGRVVAFPLDAAPADALVLQARGALRLRAGKRSVTMTAPELQGSRVTAVLGGQRTTVWRLSGRQARLAPTAARTIERRLKVTGLPRALGAFAAAPAFVCRTTTKGGAAPEPGTGEPPVKPRPAGALDVTSATVTWHVRDSFIRYIASGEGTSTLDGATSGAPANGLVYDFHFPFASGWCDPATGAARIAFTGTVRFSYRDHEIDLRVSAPEVELDGPASRVVFGIERRTVVETLDVSKAAVTSNANTFTYERIPAAVPPGAADSVFAGYYLPGDPFGWVSITFTTA